MKQTKTGDRASRKRADREYYRSRVAQRIAATTTPGLNREGRRTARSQARNAAFRLRKQKAEEEAFTQAKARRALLEAKAEANRQRSANRKALLK